MNKTEPLLFIDTVQAELEKATASSQTIYDSRKQGKNKKAVVEVETNGVKPQKNDEAFIEETAEVHQEVEKIKESSKITKQVNLLDRRAKVNHLVLVEVESEEGQLITGYFKEFKDPMIQLESEEGEPIEILLQSVTAIHILKV